MNNIHNRQAGYYSFPDSPPKRSPADSQQTKPKEDRFLMEFPTLRRIKSSLTEKDKTAGFILVLFWSGRHTPQGCAEVM